MDRSRIREIALMSTNRNTKRRTIKIFTIGSNEKTAEEFFTLLKDAGVRRVVDIRLRNNSQIQGFTKMTHLPYLLLEIAGVGYEHMPDLAPDDDILDTWKASKKSDIDWKWYEDHFIPLLEQRKIETLVKSADLDHACLLCSEPAPDKCHRRLVAEYLCDKWSDRAAVEIVHI